MAEAQLTRASSGGGSCLFAGMTLDEYSSLIENAMSVVASSGSSLFIENTVFNPPKSGQYEVIMIGGGGGGGGHGSGVTTYAYEGHTGYGAAGGSGYLTAQNVTLTKGEYVNIIIGDGGSAGWNSFGWTSYGWRNGGSGGTGGTTFLGNYLSANGGGGGGGGGAYRDDSKTTAITHGVAGKGFFEGTTSNASVEGIGGNGIIPPYNMNTASGWGKGGNISTAGVKGCIWISWS